MREVLYCQSISIVNKQGDLEAGVLPSLMAVDWSPGHTRGNSNTICPAKKYLM
jgi:hypothetical protein